jgi:hypothetical protein
MFQLVSYVCRCFCRDGASAEEDHACSTLATRGPTACDSIVESFAVNPHRVALSVGKLSARVGRLAPELAFCFCELAFDWSPFGFVFSDSAAAAKTARGSRIGFVFSFVLAAALSALGKNSGGAFSA